MHDRTESGINNPPKKLRPETSPPIKGEIREALLETAVSFDTDKERAYWNEAEKRRKEIERLQDVIKQKDKELYDIKMGLLNIYKATDKLTTRDVPRNITWLKEIVTTLLE